MMEDLLNYVVGVMLVIGAFFALVAAIGLLRLPDIYSRMHAASKAGTLGSGLMLLAIAVFGVELGAATRALAGIVFFLLTAPVAAHLLARACYETGYHLWKGSVLDEMGRRSDAKAPAKKTTKTT